MTRKETEAPSNRAPQNLYSKLPAFRSEGLQADLLFLQDLEIACTNKYLPWLCSIPQSCAGSMGHSEQRPWGSLRSPCPIGVLGVHCGHPASSAALNARGGWMPWHGWISPALNAPSLTMMNPKMETSSKDTHLNGMGAIASSLNQGVGRVTTSIAWFLFCVLVISMLHLYKGARSISLCVLSSGTAQRRPGTGGALGGSSCLEKATEPKWWSP